MNLPSPSSILELPSFLFQHICAKLTKLLFLPAEFSLASLSAALCIVLLFLGFRRSRRRKPLRVRVLVRALFPRRMLRSASSRADVGFFLFNVFLASLLFGWAILSYHFVSTTVTSRLADAFGAMTPTSLSKVSAVAILTVALFVAYELAYFVDHYLSHNIPFLWEFHKVHHEAEVLSPLTDFRVHPVDTLVFYNILALFTGITGGALNYLLGAPIEEFTVANTNAIVLLFAFLIGTLQHSQFWIAFTGPWGRLFLSPAHHQIHHSTDPAHFNKNLGNFLGLCDWLAGTLHVPGKKREKLIFGVEPRARDAHSFQGAIIAPVRQGLRHIRGVFLRTAKVQGLRQERWQQ
ncbi:MAG TPA: sterol desaturase family protein [Hyphomicrobiaceae bacterium]|nr:sterol desaturase family protein [Hyphomicrobiaceae bacterium]